MKDHVRVQERLVIKRGVEECKMPKAAFGEAFAGHETDIAWFEKAQQSAAPYAQALQRIDFDVRRCINKLKLVESTTGLSS